MARATLEPSSAARHALHHALQLASAPAATLAPPAPDDSHTSFSWSPQLRALMGPVVEGQRAGLRLEDSALLVVATERPPTSFALEGRTRGEALAWLERHYGATLRLPTHELPSHAVASGGRFPPAEAGHRLLARWFAGAAEILERFRGLQPGASAVRCWPHHFDIATLVPLIAGDASKTIGVGLSPGDGSYDQPYWYVTPWPYPPAGPRPPLPHGGRWHEQGWVGAVLRQAAPPDADGPPELARDAAVFLLEAFAVCRTLLES